MNNFLQTLKNLGPARLAAIGAVALGLIVFFVFIITRLSSPSLTVLYSDLDLRESSAIVTRLESMGVNYELKLDGTQILVPRDEVTKVRLSLAQEGLPSSGTMGYELLDNSSSGLGSSSFMQNVNRLRALEGELARTITSIQSVESARVHLVLPQRELFSRETREPSASIVLKMRGSSRLNKEQISAVQHLVASAVPGLNPVQVSIIDNQGTLLARGFSNLNSASLYSDSAIEKQQAYEARLSREIEELLSQTVGVGKVRATVRANMNFDRVKENSEIFDPDGQVVRSTQSINEKSDEVDRSGAQPVTVQGNIPEAVGEPITGTSQGAGSFYNQARNEETVNYEISRIVREEIRETGVINRLSVAVLVDGRYTKDGEGNTVYAPRAEEELRKLETIVRSAIGYDEDRGDNVQVTSMQFVDLYADAPKDTPILFGLNEDAVARIAEMLILAIAGILGLLLVVRPLLGRLFDSSSSTQLAGAGADGFLGDNLLGGPSGAPALTGPSGAALPGATGGQAALPGGMSGAGVDMSEGPDELEEMINIGQIEGKIKASSIKKIGEIIEKHPDEAVAVIRNWLYEDVSG